MFPILHIGSKTREKNPLFHTLEISFSEQIECLLRLNKDARESATRINISLCRQFGFGYRPAANLRAAHPAGPPDSPPADHPVAPQDLAAPAAAPAPAPGGWIPLLPRVKADLRPPLGGEPLQTEPDPFAELDPGIFYSGDSGESIKERNAAETQTQSEEEKEISSSESDVEMRETEKSDGKQAGSADNPDPPNATSSDPTKVTAEPMKISDLSAAEIKKWYYEIMAKGKSVPGRYNNKPSVNPKAIPAEADAVPSDSYKKIHASKMLKGKPAASGGTGSDQVLNSECGSFFNPGDNRIIRTVCQEDPLSLSVMSLSFNPVTWECSQCPKKHRVFDRGGGGEGGGTALAPSLFSSTRIFLGFCRPYPANVCQLSDSNREKLTSWGICSSKSFQRGGSQGELLWWSGPYLNCKKRMCPGTQQPASKP
jgi:hypothetical protein